MLYLAKMRNAEGELTENEQKIASFLLAHVSELKTVSSAIWRSSWKSASPVL